MNKFTFWKKPVSIEAVMVEKDILDAPIWFWYNLACEKINLYDTHWTIKTKEGVMRARYGDYCIRGIKNEIYPCDCEIFNESFERKPE